MRHQKYHAVLLSISNSVSDNGSAFNWIFKVFENSEKKKLDRLAKSNYNDGD
jgi:hypothetical protein